MSKIPCTVIALCPDAREFDAAPACTLTVTWQLPPFPQFRLTPGEAPPSLTCPVSSDTHAYGTITPIARCAGLAQRAE